MDDPFYAVRGNVADALARARQQLSAAAPSAQTLALLRTIDADLADLADSVAVVEAHPRRFAAVSPAELAARKQFVSASRSAHKELQDSVNRNAAAVQAKGQRDVRGPTPSGSVLLTYHRLLLAQALFAGPTASRQKSSESPPTADTQAFIDAEAGRQQIIMQHQDQQLDSVLGTVQNMKDVARTMGQEIDEQVSLLNEMEEQAVTTESRMQNAMSRVKTILSQSENTKSTCLIVVLVVVVIGLIFLMIF